VNSCATDMQTTALSNSNPDTLSEFCQQLFSSLPRSDQRRWAEVYVRGLVSVPGRKSIRRISEQVVGWRADQCLQQLVNQSPWDWQPLRHSLAQHVVSELPPRAWVVKEVAFPKNGMSSVAVTRQFASSAGRTLNCQLGLVAFLTGDGGSCPVNWRLLLPRSWDADPRRRARAHLPDSEWSAPRWQSLLNLIDEMEASQGSHPVPVVMDLRHEPEMAPLLRALDKRRLQYVLRVAPQTPLTVAVRPSAARVTRTAGEIATLSARGTLTAGGRPSVAAGTARSRLAATDITAVDGGLWSAHGRTRRVVADWVPGQTSPRATWLTSLDGPWLPSMLDSMASLKQASTDLSRMDDESGLRHFEGRSFRGWHHHVTLVSVAHAHRLLARLAAPDMPDSNALASA
jgi:DDE superfamily endonuclease